jgi:general stress protein 26
MEKDMAAIRADALTFLKANRAGVIATVSPEGKPHESVVYYVTDDRFNIYFLTKIDSRKYTSIKANPAVAYTIGQLDTPKTLQIEGVAAEMMSNEDKKAHVPDIMEMLSKNNPSYLPIAKMDSEVVLMWIEPKWIRWADFSVPAIGNENVFTDIPLS